jgi:response regulator RpfG family c-di-GMP phosphodiesterase
MNFPLIKETNIYRRTLVQEMKYEEAPQCKVLVIDDDYVNFLYISEILGSINIKTLRVISIDQAFADSIEYKNIDLLIISVSLALTSSEELINYIRRLYSAPVLFIDNGEHGNYGNKEIVEWADGIISFNTDTEHFSEIIADMLNKTRPCLTTM